MPDTDESAYRRHYHASGDEITVRDSEEIESDDGVFEIRMPIASTGEVRNDGDEPLTRDELSGMARQLNERPIGVFPGHGNDDKISGARYSPFERLGDWRNATVEARENEDLLVATARMPDPETLPDLGAYRQGLGIIKEQAKRGIAQIASIGWRDSESHAGGNDMMEASIVGIGADWRTNTGDEAAEVVTQAALDAGADKADLLANVRAAIESREGRPLGPEDDPQRFDDWDDCMSAMQESGHSEAEAERICGSFKDKSEKAAADPSDTAQEDSQDMTDDTPDDEQTDEQDAADDPDTQDGDTEQVRQSPAEIADMAEDIVMGHVERATDELREELEDMMGDGGENETDDDDEEDDEDDEEMNTSDADEGDSEQSADDDEADALRDEVQSLQDELQSLREDGLTADDVETPDPDEEQAAEDDESDDAEPTDEQTAETPTSGLGNYR